MKPVELGDVRNVVIILHLDKQSAEFLAEAVGYRDGLAQDIRKVLDDIERQEQEEDDDRPGIGIGLNARTRLPEMFITRGGKPVVAAGKEDSES